MATPHPRVHHYVMSQRGQINVLMDSTAHPLEFTFRPGQMVAIDNRRVLHVGREIDTNSGAHHLKGTYLDRDMLASRLHVLARNV